MIPLQRGLSRRLTLPARQTMQQQRMRMQDSPQAQRPVWHMGRQLSPSSVRMCSTAGPISNGSSGGGVAADLAHADARHMRRALELAHAACAAGEIPVGALVVDGAGAVISEAHNTTEASQNPLAHAELLAIQSAAAAVGGWRLAGCTLYVTLEPCPMCAGAILNARLRRVCYGARSPRVGADGGWIRMLPPYPRDAADAAAASAADAAAAGLPAAAGRGSGGMGSCDDGGGGSGFRVCADDERQQRRLQREGDARDSGAACTCTSASQPAAAAAAAAAAPAGPALTRRRGGDEAWDESGDVIWPVGPHPFHPDLEVTRGVLEQDCADLLRSFFRMRRRESKDGRRPLLARLQQTADSDAGSGSERED